jgi:hypothetical protein
MCFLALFIHYIDLKFSRYVYQYIENKIAYKTTTFVILFEIVVSIAMVRICKTTPCLILEFDISKFL